MPFYTKQMGFLLFKFERIPQSTLSYDNKFKIVCDMRKQIAYKQIYRKFINKLQKNYAYPIICN